MLKGGGPAQSPLVSLGVAEALAAVVCEPGCRTTDPHTLSVLIQVCGCGWGMVDEGLMVVVVCVCRGWGVGGEGLLRGCLSAQVPKCRVKVPPALWLHRGMRESV